ncbi:MAG TPA: M50 family metallopeptidase, partial [Caulobacteraceae bacterium]
MLGFLTNTVTYVVPFLLVLTLVVTVHELGHFLAAKAFGVRIDRFSIGFGRALLQRTDKAGVEWRVGWLPLGGYVKFSGDIDATGVPDKAGLDRLRQRIIAAEGAGAERAFFHFKPIWQRAAITVAGPLANFLLAIVLFTIVFMAVGESVTVAPRIGQVTPGGPAATAGFRTGDLVERVDGRAVRDFGEVQQYVMMRAGESIRFELRRGAETVTLTATPAASMVRSDLDGSEVRIGRLGMTSSGLASDIVRTRYGPVSAVQAAVRQTGHVLGTTVTYLRRIFSGRESGDQLSGPLGIARASGLVAESAASGANGVLQAAFRVTVSLLSLAGLLSVGVGFLNLL